MLNEQTLSYLSDLKLYGMKQAFQWQLEQSQSYDLCFEERLGLMIDHERSYRENKKIERLLMDSKLKDFAKSDKTEAEVMRDVYAFVDEELTKVFPDRRISSAAYVQTHPTARSIVPFFNDARRIMNVFYYPRMRDAIEAVTKFPRDAAKNGIPSAITKSTKDLMFNVMLIH